GHLLFSVGIVEVGIALICFLKKRQLLSATLVAWLAAGLLVYRLGLFWMGWQLPCSCLGNLTDAIHIPPQVADYIMKGVLAYLIIGSYGILFHRWKKREFKQTMQGSPVDGL